jgi:predicted outer membrane repeat protein
MRRTTIFAIAVLLLAATTMSAHAATITVTNTNDSGPGSLRQALTNANNGDRINFAVSGAITLTSGALVVARNVTISGPGANQLSIDGKQGSFVFSVDAIVTIATISGLTIRNGGIGNFGTLTVGNCVLSAAGIFNGGALTVSNCDISGNSGDGIANHAFSSGEARLTLINSNVSDNDSVGISNAAEEFGAVTATIRSTTVSDNSGGGFVATPNGGFGDSVQATITDCTISGNSFWGGIHADGLTNLFVTNSTISGNSANAGFPAGDSGGGIHGANYVLVENSTISGNSAATSGGGIYGGSTIEIVNSTISGNSAGTSGGGIYNFPYSLNVANSTITGNSAPSGGGIYNQRPPVGDSVVEISNTILNAGASGENIFNHGGTITSLGYNLSSDDGGGYLTGPGDQINTDPLLGPLQDNGGPTLTHALLPGSPAIDAGDPNFSPPPFKDQRDCHFDRVFNGRIDIGSFETQPPRRPCLTPRPRPTPPPRP